MVHAQRRHRVFFVLALPITFLLGLQTGRMLPGPSPLGLSAESGARLTAAATTVVLKKISDGFLPTEAQAAEPGSPGVVRKKLPAPTAAALPVGVPERAEQRPGEPTPAGAAAPSGVVVLKKVPEPPAIVAPVDTKTAVESSAGSKPVEAVTASPEPVLPPAVAAGPAVVAAPAAPVAPPAVASVPAPAQPEKPAVKAGAPRVPFSLLLASCQDRRNAEAALAAFRRLGLAPYIVLTDLGPRGMWWRTLSGAFPSYETALMSRQGPALAHAVVVKTPYANLVGEYGSDAEAAEAAAALSRKGLFPYLVKHPVSVQVMAGAFPTQPAAESHRRELEALGVATRTVQR